ncbi:MAG: glucosaminidase domain-containing protein [Proteobacteria bacterium]|nr:glucosaminidase domain-containing protein [Pseudomonadota bacterium]
MTFDPLDAEGLGRALKAAWNEAAPGEVPGLAPESLPGDLGALPVAERKRLFVRSVLPHVLRTNRRIAAERKGLQKALHRVKDGRELSEVETAWVLAVAARYGKGDRTREELRTDPARVLRSLLVRADVVPVSLALAQAAIESGWGSSRFSLEGNALFGQWVFSRDRGMVPAGRAPGAAYGVARFETIGHAVEAYVRNLNTLSAYRDFRERRAALRSQGKALDSLDLAAGLLRYSERREEYVEEVRSVIRGNHMFRYDGVRLAAVRRSQFVDILEAEGLLSSLAPPGAPPDA